MTVKLDELHVGGVLNHNIPEKYKTLESYGKPVVDHYIRRSNFYDTHKSYLEVLYDAAAGVLYPETYKYVLNPRNTKNDTLKKYPARLRNYPIIEPVIEMFLGEMATRDDDPVVVNTAEEGSAFAEKRLKFMQQILAQKFVNEANEAGIDTGVESQEVPEPEEAFEKFADDYADARSNLGEKALIILRQELQLDDVIQRCFYHWLVCGQVITFKEVIANDVFYTDCDPRDVTIFGLPEGGMIEDGEAVVYLREMSKSQVLKRWDFSDEEWKKLVEATKDVDYNRRSIRNLSTESMDDLVDSDRNNEAVEQDSLSVYFVVWKGIKKNAIITYVDPLTGTEQEKEVEASYKLDPNLGDISKEIIKTEVWYECARIGDDMYKGFGEGLVQRNEINNYKTCKLPFNGKFRGYQPDRLTSIVKIGLNFQVLTNILHYRLELTIAKSKGKVIAFPFGLIPRKGSWDEEKFFYWADANQVMFYDETQPNAAVALQGIKEIDLSLSQYVGQMWELINATRQEWWDTIGLNRQRYGETFASDLKSTQEQALKRSAVITEDMFRQFDLVIESDYNGLIDFSKVAWIDGKRGWYRNSEKRRVFFDINGTEYMDTQYGVFISNSREDKARMEEARQLLLTMGQNNLAHDAMLGILGASSVSKAENIAKKAMEVQRAHEQQIAQEQRAGEEAKANAETQKAQVTSEDKRYVADRNYDAVVDAAKIRARMQLLMDTVNEDNAVESENEVNSLQEFNSMQGYENANRQRASAAEKASLEREKMANALKIAKENKNQYDN